MKLLKYTLPLMALLILASCKKDQYFIFNDVARIQFGPDISRIYTPSFNLVDTLKPYTFYYEPSTTTQDTVFFDIYAVGGPSNKDRQFKLEQVQVAGATNPEPGKQYKSFDDPTVNKAYVIKAGEIHAMVPVVLLRDASLRTQTFTLRFNVVANDNFKTGEAGNVWRKVVFTDRLSQPAAWDASAVLYYYGKYSVTKHQFMIEQTGEKWDQDFMSGLPSDYALLTFWRGKLKTLLIDYNNAHPGNPLKDETGELVLFP